MHFHTPAVLSTNNFQKALCSVMHYLSLLVDTCRKSLISEAGCAARREQVCVCAVLTSLALLLSCLDLLLPRLSLRSSFLLLSSCLLDFSSLGLVLSHLSLSSALHLLSYYCHDFSSLVLSLVLIYFCRLRLFSLSAPFNSSQIPRTLFLCSFTLLPCLSLWYSSQNTTLGAQDGEEMPPGA